MVKTPSRYILVDGFDEGVLIYMLPIIVAYAERAGIEEILFYKTDREFLDSIYSDLGLPISRRVKIRNYELSDSLKLLMGQSRDALQHTKNILILIWLFFTFDPARWRKTRDSQGFFVYQCVLGFWDFLVKRYAEQTANFNWLQRASTGNRVLKSIIVAGAIYKRDCAAVFLGHNVYQTRALAAAAIDANKMFYLHAAFCVRQIFSNDSPPPPELDRVEMSLIVSKISDYEAEVNFRNRYSQSSSNIDAARFWAKRPSFETLPPIKHFAAIFLPVLRDSPFGWVSCERAYFDYIDWLINIVNHLKAIGIPMIIRCHPSSKSWGENTVKILKLQGIGEESNSVWIDESTRFDPLELMRRSKYLISYKGSIAAEAAAIGRKTIVFERNSVSEYCPRLVRLVGSHDEFCKIVKQSTETLADSDRLLAKKLLLAREKYNGYRNLLDSDVVFSSQSPADRDLLRARLRSSVKANLDFLIDEGKKLFERQRI